MPGKVVVASGGRSLEREVSLRSGGRAADALGSLGYDVTVLGPAEDPDVLPVIEIQTDEPFYTFRAHYDPGAATMREADLDDSTRERVEQVAAQAYRAAGCR